MIGHAIRRPRALASLFAFTLIVSASGGSGLALAGPVTEPAQSAVTPAIQAQVVTADVVPVALSACPGELTLADASTVDVWAFQLGATCPAPNAISFPGPQLRVVAGDTVNITLYNYLDVPTSILIPGQEVAASGTTGVFTDEADAVTAGPTPGVATYSILAAAEGTYLYETGTNPGIQVPMGLYGALIVDPLTSGRAYSDPATAYDVEKVLVLSEIDPNLNADPAGFDLLDYHPTYWLMNGESYPNTPNIAAMPGDQVLVRYLNAGFENLSMAVLGAYQRVAAKQAYLVPNPFDVVAEIIPAGSTADMIIDTSGLSGQLPLFNRNEFVTNGAAFPGGMLTFIDLDAFVGSPPAVSLADPVAGSSVSGSVPISITATDVEDAPGTLNVAWSVDGGVTWTPIVGTPPSTTYSDSWSTGPADDGLHTIMVRAMDSDGNVVDSSENVTVANAPMVSFTPLADAVVYGDAYDIVIDATDVDDAAGTLSVDWLMGAEFGTASWDGTHYVDTVDTTGMSEGPVTLSVTAEDSDTFTTTVDHQVVVSNQPVGEIVAPANGANVIGLVTVAIEASDAEDATGSLSVEWDIDGGAASSTSYNGTLSRYQAVWDTGTAGTGLHTLNATITDSRGNVTTDSIQVTVLPGNAIHIGNLSGSATPGGGPNWTARATVTIHSVTHTAVQGVTVYIDATRISNGGNVVVTHYTSCVTNQFGVCTVSRTVNSNQYENAVLFEITGVSGSSPYDSAANHDAAGDPLDVPPTITVDSP